jgi:hypothetical protein
MKATAQLIQEHNTMSCAALTLAGYNSDAMKLTFDPTASTNVITVTLCSMELPCCPESEKDFAGEAGKEEESEGATGTGTNQVPHNGGEYPMKLNADKFIPPFLA